MSYRDMPMYSANAYRQLMKEKSDAIAENDRLVRLLAVLVNQAGGTVTVSDYEMTQDPPYIFGAVSTGDGLTLTVRAVKGGSPS